MNYIDNALTESHIVLTKFLSTKENIEKIEKAVELMYLALQRDKKILSCGNGGSMCDAMHFAEELTGRFRKDRPAMAAVSISDPSHITCVGNDYGFDHIFSKYVEGVGKYEDVLLAISTSGNSKNVINAVNSAKHKGMKTIGLLGKDGGQLKDLVDVAIIVPAHTSDRIQEIHIKCIHIIIEGIERNIYPNNYK